jgi:hypothetical protein
MAQAGRIPAIPAGVEESPTRGPVGSVPPAHGHAEPDGIGALYPAPLVVEAPADRIADHDLGADAHMGPNPLLDRLPGLTGAGGIWSPENG